MTGTLPTELMHLPLLQQLMISHNEFTGTLSSEFARFQNLIDMEFHYNHITGTIPDSFWNINGLIILNIIENALSGSLPGDAFSRATGLRSILVSGNLFKGTIPTEIGLLKDCRTFF